MTEFGKYGVFFRDELYRMATDVGIVCREGGKQWALRCEWQEFGRASIAEPSLSDDPEAVRQLLQAIVDAAYERGVKPSRMAVELQESKHMAAHLEDMRTLAFHAFKVKR